MIFDIHIHQNRHSSDSRLAIEEAVKIAKKRGLDGICITDHDNIGIMDYAREISEKEGFPVIVGVEILTHEGDMLTFGIDTVPEGKLHAQELIDHVNAKGGVCIAAHPYRNNNRGLGDHILALKGLAGIEAFNGRTKDEDNLKAHRLGEKLRLPLFGGSDAHTPCEVGKYCTQFNHRIFDMDDFLKAVRMGALEPKHLMDENGDRFMDEGAQIA